MYINIQVLCASSKASHRHVAACSLQDGQATKPCSAACGGTLKAETSEVFDDCCV